MKKPKIDPVDPAIIEGIYNEKFNVEAEERYWYCNIKKGKTYVLSDTPYVVEMGYRWDGFPTNTPVVVLRDPLDSEYPLYGQAPFMPELLLQGTVTNPRYRAKGDVNIALEKFLRLRPVSSKRDVVIFLAKYIGKKEVYVEFDESQPTTGWIGSFNLYTQPSLEDAIDKIT